MRSIRWVLAVLSVFGLLAAGFETCLGSQATFPLQETYVAYSAPACGAPAYGLVPGCCEFRPSCCDHVWSGYCQERAGWCQRRRHGTSRCQCGACSRGSTTSCCDPMPSEAEAPGF